MKSKDRGMDQEGGPACPRGMSEPERERDALPMLRLVAENSSDLVVVLGEDGVTRFVSPAARALLGLLPEEVAGHLLTEFVHPDDRVRLRRACHRAWATLRAPPVRFRVRDARFGERWLEGQARLVSGIPGSSSGGAGLVLNIHDIDARLRAERVANEASAKLREVSRLLNLAEVLADVGHFRIETGSAQVDCSHEACRLVGQSRTVISAREALRLIDSGDRLLLLRQVRSARRSSLISRFRVRLAGNLPSRVNVEIRLYREESATHCRPGLVGVLGRTDTILGPFCPLEPERPAPPSARRLPPQSHGAAFAPFDDRPRLRPASCPPLALLLADDNPLGLALMRDQLRALGHHVRIAEDGRSALGLALAERFDCIFMDVQMPELDGVAATRAIRTSAGPNAAAPILALLPDRSRERARFLAQAGFTDVLAKPLDPVMLEQRLASLSIGVDTAAAVAATGHGPVLVPA
ncbi:response regulator [Sphingomonas ginkgonis]|uniref:Response regulator n=1 Tax=Sphingomonas ginkgonis TaxID=2315330 RepID=A0A429V752_9SPHN|nr:response regulator [Sphingomonas ginkgonis]RST29722.1 response regulator [Sphingomonas ginkgonis]